MSLTLLIVEQQPSCGPCLTDLFRNRFDTIRSVRSASEALEVASQVTPDVVITPFPAVTDTGELLTAILKRDPRTSGCRVLAYSDWCWANTRAKAMAQGCEAFIPTSAPAEELVAAVDRLLGFRGPSAPATGAA